MNMTVVTFELVIVCSLLLLATVVASKEQQDMPAEFESVGDERRQLDDEQLGSIVKDFGGHLQETMEVEMNRLLNELQMKPSVADHEARKKHPRGEISAEELERLQEANSGASKDIKERVEMAGDNGGNLPQMGLGSMATSFAAAASGRLSAAGSYIGNKMRAVGDSLKKRIPAKLRRFFKWPTFLRFKIRFHKVYKSLREELYRQMIFLRTHIVVGMQHVRYLLRRDTHLLGQNQYSDWTEKEYLEKAGNHEAERGPADLDPRAKLGFNAAEKAKLEELAKSGRNIFGQRVGRVVEKSRKKRDAENNVDADGDEEMYDSDELNESEDNFEEMELDNELESDADSNPEDAFKLIDEFVMDIDLNDLDQIDSNVDDALKANNGFKPIDLRGTGCLIKSENQNSCGNCYSVVIHGLASYYHCMESGLQKPIRYHPRFMSDCGKYMTRPEEYAVINGCHGGRISKGYYFTKTVGVQRFPYYTLAQVSSKVVDDTCAYPRPPTTNIAQHGWDATIETIPFFQSHDFTLIKMEEVDLHLRTVGPVAVNSRTWRQYKEYAGGILDDVEEADTSTLHSMMIVGHDKDANGRDYWIILNSSGIAWGENGYLRFYVDKFKDFGFIYGGFKPSSD